MITSHDNLSILKIPSCPGLFGTDTEKNIINKPTIPVFPPMIPLTWQIAVQSDDEDPPITPYKQITEETKTASNISERSNDQINISEQSNIDIIHTLDQFSQFTDFNLCVNDIINGFIRLMQSKVSLIIPNDINNICFSFYYEIENKYIHFGYKLYKIVSDKLEYDGEYSGKYINEIVNINNLLSNNENVRDICNELISTHIIELVSYTTSFFAYKPVKNPLFVVSNDYKYHFSTNTIDAFEQCYNIGKFSYYNNNNNNKWWHANRSKVHRFNKRDINKRNKQEMSASKTAVSQSKTYNLKEASKTVQEKIDAQLKEEKMQRIKTLEKVNQSWTFWFDRVGALLLLISGVVLFLVGNACNILHVVDINMK